MSSYSQSASDFTELSSDGGRSSVSRTDDGENAGPDLLKGSSLSLASSPGSAPSFGDSFNSHRRSDRGSGEREDTSDSDFDAKVSDFEAAVSDNESTVDSSTIANSSQKQSSEESETETDQEDSSVYSEEEEDDGDTLSGILSASEYSLQSTSEAGRTSSPSPVGLKQPAAFLTQFMGEYDQRKSHDSRKKVQGVRQVGKDAGSRSGDSVDVIHAIRSGDLSSLKELLSKKSQRNVTDGNRRTPLHIACSLGRTEMVKMFIKLGMNVDACSVTGQTPLHEACIGGHYDILRMLLAEVSDLDAVDSNGLSAAHYCALNGEVKCLDLLCEQGCDMCLEDNLGRSDVHLAALHDHTNVIVCLMERGMELDMPDKEGKTPAHYAAQHGSLSTLGVLVKNAVDITTGDESGKQPVHEAASHNQLDCLRYLVKKGAKTTAMDDQKRTPLHMAAHYGAVDCLHWLLENGADPNLPDGQGFTSLHHAAAGGHAECFHCLMEHGAESSISNSNGENALDVARRCGKPRIIGKAIDGTKQCSMCVNKAAKEKLEEASKPSPVHKPKWKQNEGSLFLHPLPQSQHERQPRTSSIHNPRKKSRSAQDNKRLAALPKRNMAAKYYGPVF